MSELSMSGLQPNTFDSAWLAERGIIHEHVDPPLGRYNMAHRLTDGFFIGNIPLDRFNMVRTYLFQPIQAPGRGEHVIIIFGEKFSRSASDSAGCAGLLMQFSESE